MNKANNLKGLPIFRQTLFYKRDFKFSKKTAKNFNKTAQQARANTFRQALNREQGAK